MFKDYYYIYNKLIYFLILKEYYVNGLDKMVFKGLIELFKEEEEVFFLLLMLYLFFVVIDDDFLCLEIKFVFIVLNCCE